MAGGWHTFNESIAENKSVRFAGADSVVSTAFVYSIEIVAVGVWMMIGAFGLDLSSVFWLMIISGLIATLFIVYAFFTEMDIIATRAGLKERRDQPESPRAEELRPVAAGKVALVNPVPAAFIEKVFDVWEASGKLPTVREMEAAGYDLATANQYFGEMVKVGIVVGRQERGASGTIAPGWTRWRAVGVLS